MKGGRLTVSCASETLVGKSLLGGTMVGIASSGDDCVLSCLGPCLAVTFDSKTGACVHHHTNTHCNTPVNKSDTTLYRTTDCNGMSLCDGMCVGIIIIIISLFHI